MRTGKISKSICCSLMALLCFIASCDKDNREEEHMTGGDAIVIGMASHAHNLMAVVGEFVEGSYLQEMEIIPKGTIVASDMGISVITYDTLDSERVENYYSNTKLVPVVEFIPQTTMRDPIPEVEKALEEYENHINKTRTVLWRIQYRLEGVTTLSVTANKEYCGIAAGEELGGIFHIVRYAPPLVFSYDTYELDKRGQLCKDDIADRLVMKPLAQPCMTLMLKENAREAAEDITFTITMTLTNGKVLTATTPAVSIVK